MIKEFKGWANRGAENGLTAVFELNAPKFSHFEQLNGPSILVEVHEAAFDLPSLQSVLSNPTAQFQPAERQIMQTALDSYPKSGPA